MRPSFSLAAIAGLASAALLACGARSSIPGLEGDPATTGRAGRGGTGGTAARGGAGGLAGASTGGRAGAAAGGRAGSGVGGQAGTSPLPPPVSCGDGASCDDGIACTQDSCNAATGTCEHDACDSLCDDQLFCTGVERCDATRGCVSGEPACALGLACSKDSCDETARICTHTQLAKCGPSVDLLVTDEHGAFLTISAYTGVHAPLPGVTGGFVYLDIAILGGRWFGLGAASLVELEPFTNKVKRVVDGVSLPANSLGAGPDGFLYAASTSVWRIHPDLGEPTVVATLPPGSSSSGDIAFVNGRMFVSTDGPCGGGLAEVDVNSGTSTIRGGDGLGCVYGLASANETLYLANCDGTVGTFDPDSGEAKLLSTAGGIQVYGADVLP